MSDANILFTINNGIGSIQFNRPQKLNAVNSEVLIELEATIASCETNE